MSLISKIILITLLVSCTTTKPAFKKELACTNQAIKYLKNPRNVYKKRMHSEALMQALAKTSNQMQSCYESFKERSNAEEFNTCLVVGVDEKGRMDFHNFGSREVTLDQEFLNCAAKVTKKINYGAYGKNYILLQSYQFYVEI